MFGNGNWASNPVKISVIKAWGPAEDSRYPPGVLVKVDNGKGLLREVCGRCGGEAYLTLMLGDRPLVQFQGDEYDYLTCERIIKSGYGMEQSFHLEMPGLNKPAGEQPLAAAVDAIYPLLGLLTTGYYVILDTKLHPTDGNGNLFWERPTEGILRGSSQYDFGNGEWGRLIPHFTIATQPPAVCSRERVEYYRSVTDCRAIAYYMDGYLTALLDGHHKTLAAALNHQDVNALVIMPGQMHYFWPEDPRERMIRFRFGDLDVTAAELGVTEMDEKKLASRAKAYNARELLSDAGMERLNQCLATDAAAVRLPFETDHLADFYPDVDGQAAIDRGGELSDARVAAMISGEQTLTPEEGCNVMEAMCALRHPDGIHLGKILMEQRQRQPYYCTILSCMMKYPRTDELEQYFIERLVEMEDEYPEVKRLILKYL